jgi:hypothetical protein
VADGLLNKLIVPDIKHRRIVFLEQREASLVFMAALLEVCFEKLRFVLRN